MKRLLSTLIAILVASGLAFADDFSRVKAKHILLNSKADAIKIKQDIDEGGSFEYYARRYSQCPSGRRNDGSLGYFGRGQMVKEFEDAAFNAEIGKVSEPVKTQFGWHLILVEDKIK